MTSALYRENFAQIEWKPFAEEPRQYTPPKRSNLVAPFIIGDTMEPVQSMVDGKEYTSKSKLRASYRAHNCVEVGNDPARLRPRQKPRIDRKAVRETLERAESRFNRGERAR